MQEKQEKGIIIAVAGNKSLLGLIKSYCVSTKIDETIPSVRLTEGLHIRVIHEKSNHKFLNCTSVILFVLVIKYIMQMVPRTDLWKSEV